MWSVRTKRSTPEASMLSLRSHSGAKASPESPVCTCRSLETSPGVGTWTGTDSDGDQATFVFGADMATEIKLEGVPRLSTQTVTNGHVEWTGDISADPMPIDVIIVRAGQEVGRIPMIARWKNDDTLVIQLSRDMKARPTSFEMTARVFQVVAHRE